MAFSDELTLAKVELRDAGVPIREALELARIDRSTWTRWNGKQSPKYATWLRFRRAVDALVERNSRQRPVAA